MKAYTNGSRVFAPGNINGEKKKKKTIENKHKNTCERQNYYLINADDGLRRDFLLFFLQKYILNKYRFAIL